MKTAIAPTLSRVLSFLDQQYDIMVKSAIQRSNKGERLDFSFSLTAHDLKAQTRHVRLRQEVIDYVLAYFKAMCVEVIWDKRCSEFRISINLIKAAFTPSQAQLLNTLWKRT